MKKVTKEEWIAALRSGKYNQGYGILYSPSDNCYCSLGVLCDIAGLSKSSDNKWFGFDFSDFNEEEYKPYEDYIPKTLAIQVGITHQQAIVTMNDHSGYSFNDFSRLY